MTEKLDFITLPASFENYKWYKPILVIIATIVIFAIFSGILIAVFSSVYGWNFILSMTHGYEVMNTEMGQIFTDLAVIILIPSLFVATKIVKDRPFSSYSSSRGGWNYKLYFKAMIIPFIIYIIFEAISSPLMVQKEQIIFHCCFFSYALYWCLCSVLLKNIYSVV